MSCQALLFTSLMLMPLGCHNATSASECPNDQLVPSTTWDGVLPTLGEVVSLTTSQGNAHGELVAIYDRRLWWNDASLDVQLALFDGARLAQYPADASFSMPLASTLLTLTSTPLDPGTESYRATLRRKGLLLKRSPLTGVQHVLTAHDSYHLEENGYGDYAYDLVRTDATGRRYQGDGTQNDDYYVWNAEVFLPVTGTVIDLVTDVPDNLPGAYPLNGPNNLVGVHLFGAFYLYFLHLQQNSVPATLAVDQVVQAGTLIGRVGNAGVSLEPHLHVVLLWYDALATPPRSWSVPLEFADLFTAETAAGPAVLTPYALPTAGTWISNAAF